MEEADNHSLTTADTVIEATEQQRSDPQTATTPKEGDHPPAAKPDPEAILALVKASPEYERLVNQLARRIRESVVQNQNVNQQQYRSGSKAMPSPPKSTIDYAQRRIQLATTAGQCLQGMGSEAAGLASLEHVVERSVLQGKAPEIKLEPDGEALPSSRQVLSGLAAYRKLWLEGKTRRVRTVAVYAQTPEVPSPTTPHLQNLLDNERAKLAAKYSQLAASKELSGASLWSFYYFDNLSSVRSLLGAISDANDLWQVMSAVSPVKYKVGVASCRIVSTESPTIRHSMETLDTIVRHVGVNAASPSSRQRKGVEVLRGKSGACGPTLAELRHFALCGGLPPSLRSAFYVSLLDMKEDKRKPEHLPKFGESFEKWQQRSAPWDLSVYTELVMIANGENYFVFEDTLHDVVHAMCLNEPPFQGEGSLVAPLCFVFGENRTLLFDAAIAMKRMFWDRLREFAANDLEDQKASDPSQQVHPLVGCSSIEAVIECFDYMTVLSSVDAVVRCAELGVPASRLLLPWMVSCFALVLQPLHVLWIWDLMLGCRSLAPIAIVAAALFHSLRHRIVAAKTVQQLRMVLVMHGFDSAPKLFLEAAVVELREAIVMTKAELESRGRE